MTQRRPSTARLRSIRLIAESSPHADEVRDLLIEIDARYDASEKLAQAQEDLWTLAWLVYNVRMSPSYAGAAHDTADRCRNKDENWKPSWLRNLPPKADQ